MKTLQVLRLVTFLLIIQNGTTYKILGVFHFPIRSHHILGSTLLKALAEKGHEVTMISPYPLENPPPNYKDIELTGIADIVEDPQLRNAYTKSQSFSELSGLIALQGSVSKVNEFALNHTAVQQLISSKQKFDVVIQVYFGNDAYFGLANYFEAHSIVLSPIGSSEITNEITKNPAPMSYISNILSAYPDGTMNFWQRVQNTLVRIMCQFYTLVIQDKEQTFLLNKYLPNAPSIRELRNNVSLVLLNSHFSIEGSRAYLPNMIPIGGFHIKPPNELTGELKEFMDSASNGVILFSLGSNVRSSELSEDKIQAILDTFSALPQKVLWKFEANTKIHNVPYNVKTLKWLPQSDILAHPNVKAFITHGGLLSTTEAVYHGVPMVGIPLYGDQSANVNEAVKNGYAVKVDLSTISYDQLTWAIKEVIDNPRYRNAAQRLSKILKDNPMSALDKAIYWIEYVIEHKGAHHLKSAAINLKWYQLNSLDVFGFLFCILLLILLALRYMLGKICKLLIALVFNVYRKSLHKEKQR